jgi:CRISPR-associated protein Cas5t
MERLWLRARAPFAAYRAMQAGVYRPSAPTMPPSAAFGLVLNCAGIEMRDPAPAPTTRIRRDVPRIRIAIGSVSPTETSTLYQQLHTYPVGTSGQENKPRTHGAKYWIAPARREILVDLDVMIGVDADRTLLDRVRQGLRGELPDQRYGLPFAGDNNLLFDRIDVLNIPVPARWYTPLSPGDVPRRGSCRLTVGIDRENSSKTTSQLFAPIETACTDPPDEAWTWTPATR